MGFFAPAAEALGKTVEKDVLENLGSKIGREVSEGTVMSAKHYFGLTEQGKTLEKIVAATDFTETKLSGQLDAPRQKLWNGIKKDPILKQNITRYGNMGIGDIHQDLVSQDHPLQQESLQILRQGDTETPDHNIAELGTDHRRQAVLLAQAQHMGTNMEHVAPLIAELRVSPDPNKRILAQRYADTISLHYRDTERMTGRTPGKETEEGKGLRISGEQSRSKANLNKAFSITNEFRDMEGLEPIPMLDTTPAYTERGAAEKMIDGIIRGPQAAMAVIPHALMEKNLMFRTPARAYLKSLFGANREEAIRLTRANQMLAFNDMDAITHDFNARTGKVAQWTKSPTLGKILDVAYNMPGLPQLRRMQIRHAGSVGIEAAHDFADRMMRGSKMAEEELNLMRIDPDEVRRNGGTLSPEQLEKAAFHYADNTMFTKGAALNMPMKADAGFWQRSFNMYHFFVRNQTLFMTSTMMRALRNGDTAGIARMIGVMSILSPAIAPLFKSLQILARTGSPTQAGKPIKSFYDPSSIGEWGKAYAEAFGEMWGWGMASYYMDSAFNNSWWKPAFGSKITTPLVYGHDLLTGAAGKDPKQFERDILELAPVIGKPLSHKLLPTRAEQGPKFSPHSKRFRFKKATQ